MTKSNLVLKTSKGFGLPPTLLPMIWFIVTVIMPITSCNLVNRSSAPNISANQTGHKPAPVYPFKHHNKPQFSKELVKVFPKPWKHTFHDELQHLTLPDFKSGNEHMGEATTESPVQKRDESLDDDDELEFQSEVSFYFKNFLQSYKNLKMQKQTNMKTTMKPFIERNSGYRQGDSLESSASSSSASSASSSRLGPDGDKVGSKRYTKALRSSESRRNYSDSFLNKFGHTEEQWNQIENEHHIKQQQHADEMLALRRGDYSGSRPNENRVSKLNTENYLYYVPGVLTPKKNLELGTTVAVDESRRNFNVMGQTRALAHAHVSKVHREASCHQPQPRVLRIMKDTSKVYAPDCTVLHRCGDDTGCCKTRSQVCGPKKTHTVELYFFVKSLNEKRHSIESLQFINHTECQCMEKSRLSAFIEEEQLLRDERQNLINCNCPKLYEKILQDDGNCRCDCSSSNTDCNSLKRGMEHFSMFDRKCISEGRCRLPTCEYGEYIMRRGHCPPR